MGAQVPAGSRNSWRRPVQALLSAAALLLSACAGPGARSDQPDSSGPTNPPAATGSPTHEWTDLKRARGVVLPINDADWLQVVGEGVWTSQEDSAGTRLLQLDATTGKARATVSTKGPTCTAMDTGYGSLWAAECTEPSSSLLRVDPRTGTLQARIPLRSMVIHEEGSVASNGGSVWVVTKDNSRRLVKIDPGTNRVIARYPLPLGVTGVRAGLGALWATNPDTGRLLRIDPSNGKVVATIRVGEGPRFFAVGPDAVWVQDNGDGTVSRVDPRTNRVVATITVDSGPVDGGDLAVGGGYVWARVSSWLVSEIDPATNTVVARYGPGSGSGSVAASSTALWISAHDVDQVYRVPLR
jgi:YVTN family beta-propeller protein